MKNEPQEERSPRKFPWRIRPGPRLWHFPDLLTFIWKYVFLNISYAFQDYSNLLMDKYG